MPTGAGPLSRGEVGVELGLSNGGENYASRLERSAGTAESASLGDLFGMVYAHTDLQHSSGMLRGLCTALLSQIRVTEVDELGSGGVLFLVKPILIRLVLAPLSTPSLLITTISVAPVVTLNSRTPDCESPRGTRSADRSQQRRRSHAIQIVAMVVPIVPQLAYLLVLMMRRHKL